VRLAIELDAAVTTGDGTVDEIGTRLRVLVG
jgi:hypothetical protein